VILAIDSSARTLLADDLADRDATPQIEVAVV